MKPCLLLILCTICLLSCSTEILIPEAEKETKELIFSIDKRLNYISANGEEFKNIYSAKTNTLNFSFDIIDGNGEYEIEFQEHCKATISNNKVSVDLLKQNSIVTIVDKHKKKESIWIESSSETFKQHQYLYFDLSQKQIAFDRFNFGEGEYTAEKIHGNSAEIRIINDILYIKALKGGTTYFYIIDKMGEKRALDVSIGETYYFNNNQLNIQAVHDQTINIMFINSEKWRVADGEEEKHKDLFIHLVMHNANKQQEKYSNLQITITKNEDITLLGSIKIINNEGDVAYINLSDANH